MLGCSTLPLMKTPAPTCFARLPVRAIITVIFGAFLLVSAARGELIFSDSFDYPQGDLGGQGPPPNSPPGQGGWETFNGTPSVTAVGLEFPGIFWTGNSALVHGLDDTTGDKAVAALGPVTADDGIVWVAFLVRKASNPNGRDGFAVVSLGNDVTGPSIGIGMLFNKDRYGLDNNTGGKGARARTAVRPNQKTVWLVTKLDFNNAQEYLWVNPDPETEPDITEANAQNPMTAEFVAAGFHEIVLKIGYTVTTFQFDELRVGTTFADVVNPFAAP